MNKIYKVEIITRSEKLNILKDSLAQKGIKGMTVSNVMGAGNQKVKRKSIAVMKRRLICCQKFA